ncbi:MAG TPA: hypothetical protein PLM91_02430 [Bacillota bacterium]|jgi:hypothetical protein|nr:hypothetical protein [Bacillota bacterium]HPQ02940.1 hypothetical protein [Bacillota bacterium]
MSQGVFRARMGMLADIFELGEVMSTPLLSERLCCSGYTVVTEEIMLARSRMVKARSIAYLTGRPCHYVLLKLSPFAYVRASAAF